MRGRCADRIAGSPALGPLPRPDHADGRGRRDRRADDDRLPERRRWLHRAHRVRRSFGPPARSSRPGMAVADTAYFRYVVVIARPDVHARPRAHREQAGPCLGCDSRERTGGARGRREHHALQDVGVRTRLVHDGRRRLSARRADREPEGLRVPGPGVDHPLRHRDDRRRLQPLGRGCGGRLLPVRPLPPPDAVGARPEPPLRHLRCRHAAGAAHRAGRDLAAVPEGHGESGTADRRRRSQGHRARGAGE